MNQFTQKIASFLPNGPTTKSNFRDTLEYDDFKEILAEEENKIKENDENSDDGNMCKDEVENNKKNLEIIEDIDNIMKEDDFNEIDKGLGNIDIKFWKFFW